MLNLITPRIYRAISIVALPLASLYLMLRSRKQPAYKQFWSERFAWGDFPLRTSRPRVWIHAVSLGETNAARPLIEQILKRWSEVDILLTHMTPTGREAGKKLIEQLGHRRIRQCYLPYDAPYAVAKFFRQTKPTLGIVMRTEVWPNLMYEAEQQNIPMVLANARESEKSLKKAQRVYQLIKPAFRRFSLVLAQSEKDARRLSLLGATNIVVTGSVKFDIRPNYSQVETAKTWKKSFDRPVIALLSSRTGERVQFIRAFKQHKKRLQNALFLIVPRHPERFGEVIATLEEERLTYCRRSSFLVPGEMDKSVDVLLGDSMGEMSLYCGLADMVAMGGSYATFGSQNVIEPAMVGCPVVVGPSTFNFAQIVEDGLSAGALVQVSHARQCMKQFVQWLHNDTLRMETAIKAKQFAQSHAGATTRMISEMEELWKKAQKN